jgi:hypothetical protein
MPKLPPKHLIYNINIEQRGRFLAAPNCVFFAQHSGEKRPKGLWVGLFFIA